MSWSGWGSRLNVTSIVSQGLEQVSKLREDVEKQFDQVVTGVNGGAPYLRPGGSTSSASTIEGAEASPSAAPPLQPPAAKAAATSVDDIGVTPPLSAFGKDVLANLRLQQQPPASADGKRRLGGVLAVDASALPAVLKPHAVADEADALFEEGKAAAPKETATVESGEKVETTAGDKEHAAPPAGCEGEGPEAVEKELTGDSSRDETRAAAAGDDDDDGEALQVGDKGERVDQEEEKEEAPAEVAVASPEEEAAGNDLAWAESVGATAAALEDADSAALDGGDQGEEAEEEASSDVERVEASDATNVSDEDAGDALARVEDGDAATATATGADAAVVESLRRELQLREAQLLATSSTVAELHNELDKTCQREVAAVERARNLSDEVERMRKEMERQASSLPRPSELHAMQYELEEKDARLQALLEEGHALSVKQSQYEQRLRMLRKEKDEEEERRLKFQTQSEALSVQLQDVTAKLKAADEESKRLAKDAREAQASAQGTATKLRKAEQDAATAASQLEAAQALVKTLSKDKEAMQSQLEALKGTTQSHDALTVEKQELQRTIDCLQLRVRELEDESQGREERARSEMQAMKKKWLDAVARVDAMGQSVSEATQPLLRQMNALREDQRARQDAWKATERALLARIDDSYQLRVAMEREKLEAELQVQALQTRMESMESEMQGKQVELRCEREKLDAALQEAQELRGQVDASRVALEELKGKLDDETEAKQQLMARVNADRLKKRELAERSEGSGALDPPSSELMEAREREVELRMQLERSRSELSEAKALLESNGFRPGSQRHHRLSSSSRDGSDRGLVDSDAPRSGDGSLAMQASILKSTLEAPADTAGLLSANTTVLGLSQLQQRLRLAEGEKRMLKQQLTALEAKQKQNTDDIVRLSTRNALLETKEAELREARQELAQVKQRQQVLLELFGEKEEQVEELQAEVGELKAFYRKQLDTLAGQQRK